MELGDLERRRRKEERRRRYESMLGVSLCWQVTADKLTGGSGPNSQRHVEEDVEECWRLVEKTAFRADRSVPVITEHSERTEAAGQIQEGGQ